MFDLIDDIFNDFASVNNDCRKEWHQPARFNKQFSTSSFPPTNILIDKKTKVLTIQSALAGIHEDWINLEFDGDSLKLIIDVPGDKQQDILDELNNHYFQLGLKKVQHTETAWTVDPRYFDREKVDVKFDNGLLTITIPPRDEVAPKKIPIFGNLKLEKTE